MQRPLPEQDQAAPFQSLQILLVEDHLGDAELTRIYLKIIGVQPERITHVESLREAIQHCPGGENTLVLLDMNLSDSHGLSTVEKILEAGCNCPLLVLTGNDEDSFGPKVVSMGAQDYLGKTQLNEKTLSRSIRYALERHRLLKAQEELVLQLQDALENVKTLKGIVPICAKCKKIRDDQGYWKQVEEYISQHTEADFSHGICPECMDEYYEELKRDPKISDKAPSFHSNLGG